MTNSYAEVWDDSVAPGGYVCSRCGMPVESEPCPEHAPPSPDTVEDLEKCLRCLDLCEPGLACVSEDATCSRPCRPVASGGVLNVGGPYE